MKNNIQLYVLRVLSLTKITIKIEYAQEDTHDIIIVSYMILIFKNDNGLVHF